jgi:hypothetical protein
MSMDIEITQSVSSGTAWPIPTYHFTPGPRLGEPPEQRARRWRRARRVPDPPRNGPCPCGSGRKAKRCCWD